MREAIERCVQPGALARYKAYHRMVQFRNFIVHRYERIDTAFYERIDTAFWPILSTSVWAILSAFGGGGGGVLVAP